MAGRELDWGRRTYVMGVINVTPDSFSGDGLATPGRSSDEVMRAAVAQAGSFVAHGAKLLDVGAESTRPRQVYGDHPEVDAQTEAALAVPVVRALVHELGERALVSIDTSKGSVAREAVAAGARIVNDVWAGRDAGTIAAAVAGDAYLVVVHNQETTDYPGGLLETVIDRLRRAIEAAVEGGMPRGRLIADPGFGFGKTGEHNLELLHRLREIKSALGGVPLLVGTSRKRFIGETLDGAPPAERVEGTAASVALAIAAGADIVRVHDVAEMARVVKVSDAIVRWRPPG